MKIQITTKHYDFILTRTQGTGDDISDIFSRMAIIIAELQMAAEEAEAMEVDTKHNNHK